VRLQLRIILLGDRGGVFGARLPRLLADTASPAGRRPGGRLCPSFRRRRSDSPRCIRGHRVSHPTHPVRASAARIGKAQLLERIVLTGKVTDHAGRDEIFSLVASAARARDDVIDRCPERPEPGMTSKVRGLIQRMVPVGAYPSTAALWRESPGSRSSGIAIRHAGTLPRRAGIRTRTAVPAAPSGSSATGLPPCAGDER